MKPETRNNLLGDACAAAAGFAVLCVVGAVLTLSIYGVEHQAASDGRQPSVETEALSRILYSRER